MTQTLLGPDIVLDDDTHDLLFVNGDLLMDVDVGQAVKIALLFIKGEWFLNINLGVPYFDQFFIKAPRINLLRSILRKTIEDTPGINSVLALDLSYDPQARTLSVSFRADTDNGEIAVSTQVTP